VTGETDTVGEPGAGSVLMGLVGAAAQALPPTAVAWGIVDLVASRRYEQRVARHLARVDVLLRELLDREPGLSEKDLQENEILITTVLRTAEAARRTHQERKLDQLRNAAVKPAVVDLPEQYHLIFVDLIDRFTEAHVALLGYLADPKAAHLANGLEVDDSGFSGNRKQALLRVFPGYKAEDDLLTLLLSDLRAAGLLTSTEITGMVSASAEYDPLASGLGLTFLAYLDPPW